MSKLVLFNLISLDGFFEQGKWGLDWHNVDEEFNDFSIEQLDSTDGLIFGKDTYLGMASYWTSEQALQTDPLVARRMNAIPKYVFSRTLAQADWSNTRLVKGNASQEMNAIQQKASRDLFIFGSADLARTFIKDGLIDEYRILLNPILLGSGTPLFAQGDGRLNLALQRAQIFRNGNVLLVYEPVK